MMAWFGLGAWHFHTVVRALNDLDYTTGGAMIRAAMVIGCYALWNVAYVVMLVEGRRHKRSGMPVLGAASALAICAIALYGPFSDQSHLFFYKTDYPLLGSWALSLILQTGVIAQCVRYGETGRVDGPKHALLRAVRAAGVLGGLIVTFWTFVVYYQDYYVNEICPIAVLVISASMFTLLEHPGRTGRSLGVAWLLAIGNFLLYAAVVLGDMSDPYPEASFGYGFIYWIYVVTVVLNFTYVYQVAKQRRALRLAAAAHPSPVPAAS